MQVDHNEAQCYDLPHALLCIWSVVLCPLETAMVRQICVVDEFFLSFLPVKSCHFGKGDE